MNKFYANFLKNRSLKELLSQFMVVELVQDVYVFQLEQSMTVRLFGTVRLLLLENFPTHMFIWTRTFIWNPRVNSYNVANQ